MGVQRQKGWCDFKGGNMGKLFFGLLVVFGVFYFSQEIYQDRVALADRARHVMDPPPPAPPQH